MNHADEVLIREGSIELKIPPHNSMPICQSQCVVSARPQKNGSLLTKLPRECLFLTRTAEQAALLHELRYLLFVKDQLQIVFKMHFNFQSFSNQGRQHIVITIKQMLSILHLVDNRTHESGSYFCASLIDSLYTEQIYSNKLWATYNCPVL